MFTRGKYNATITALTENQQITHPPVDQFGRYLVAGRTRSYIDVTPVCDTSIYAAGDVLFDTIIVPNAMRVADAQGKLDSIVLIDEDDQGIAVDLFFFSALSSLGTFNVAPSISDAAARAALGAISIATGDYIDLGGVRVATKLNVTMPVKPATGARDIYVGGITRGGTPTYTASGIKLRLGFDND